MGALESLSRMPTRVNSLWLNPQLLIALHSPYALNQPARREFSLRRQVQCAEQFEVAASQTALSVRRLHQFLCSRAK